MEKECKDEKTLMYEQALLLAEWNRKNVDKEPEQVRKNIETLSAVATQPFNYPFA